MTDDRQLYLDQLNHVERQLSAITFVSDLLPAFEADYTNMITSCTWIIENGYESRLPSSRGTLEWALSALPFTRDFLISKYRRNINRKLQIKAVLKVRLAWTDARPYLPSFTFDPYTIDQFATMQNAPFIAEPDLTEQIEWTQSMLDVNGQRIKVYSAPQFAHKDDSASKSFEHCPFVDEHVVPSTFYNGNNDEMAMFDDYMRPPTPEASTQSIDVEMEITFDFTSNDNVDSNSQSRFEDISDQFIPAPVEVTESSRFYDENGLIPMVPGSFGKYEMPACPYPGWITNPKSDFNPARDPLFTQAPDAVDDAEWIAQFNASVHGVAYQPIAPVNAQPSNPIPALAQTSTSVRTSSSGVTCLNCEKPEDKHFSGAGKCGEPGKKWCAACRLYWGKHGKHRPIEVIEATLAAMANAQANPVKFCKKCRATEPGLNAHWKTAKDNMNGWWCSVCFNEWYDANIREKKA